MQIEINITLTDDTSEEQMSKAGLSREAIRTMCYDSFRNLLAAACDPDCQTTLKISVKDNTKEAQE